MQYPLHVHLFGPSRIKALIWWNRNIPLELSTTARVRESWLKIGYMIFQPSPMDFTQYLFCAAPVGKAPIWWTEMSLGTVNSSNVWGEWRRGLKPVYIKSQPSPLDLKQYQLCWAGVGVKCLHDSTEISPLEQSTTALVDEKGGNALKHDYMGYQLSHLVLKLYQFCLAKVRGKRICDRFPFNKMCM